MTESGAELTLQLQSWMPAGAQNQHQSTVLKGWWPASQNGVEL